MIRTNRDRILAGAGLAAVAVVGALAVVLLWGGGGSGEPEPIVTSKTGIQAYADLDTYEVHFGDTVTARVEITVDRSRVDPDSIEVGADFTPWKPIGGPEVLRRDGSKTTYVETRYTLRCLESFCTTQDESGVQAFRPARVTYTEAGAEPAGAEIQTLQAAWPDLLVTARYAPPSASTGASGPADWRANLVSLPSATYRLGPWLLVGLLFAGALLLAGAAVALVARTRPRPVVQAAATPAARRGPLLTPLEYALQLLEDPGRVNGSGDQRRALELVADGLVSRGDGGLARTARALAWSRPVPAIDQTRGIATRARKVLTEGADAALA